jgi:rfaE bifunctional protein kinase chain/domain
MKKIIENFTNQKIAVIGDLILDKYIFGKVDRISPEAPVPIVKVESEKYVPGGAANVAANISSLGGKAFLIGIVGQDQYQDELVSKLDTANIDYQSVLVDPSKRTTLKTRVIGLNQQLLRIDHEDTHYIESHFEDKFITKLKEIENLSAIILSDYAKGTITKELLSQLIKLAYLKEIPLIIDPKPKHKNWYRNSFLVTPNKKEAQEISGITIETEEDYLKAGEKLVNDLSANIIITAGAEGMYVFERLTPQPHLSNKEGEICYSEDDTKRHSTKSSNNANSSIEKQSELTPQPPLFTLKEGEKSLNSQLTTHNLIITHIPTQAREVYDVSGAGDTVVAALTLALSSGASLFSAAKLANKAAGIKVGKSGTQPVYLQELLREINV